MKIDIPKDKFILDACCGPRMMWLNKQHPNALYIDIRNKNVYQYSSKLIKPSRTYKIKPDIVMDFRDLKFKDNTFNLVVMDPPHIKALKPEACNLTKAFGSLRPETWQSDLKKGLKECMRVLKPNGVLIFKWNDCDIPFKTMLLLFPFKPLFYNYSYGKKGEGKSRTAWFCFMKIPKEVE